MTYSKVLMGLFVMAILTTSLASQEAFAIAGKPIPVITSNVISPTNDISSFEVTMTFDKVMKTNGDIIKQFNVDDITVVNGTLSNFVIVPLSDEKIFTVDVTPSITDGNVTVFIADGVAKARNSDGGLFNVDSNLLQIKIDTTKPSFDVDGHTSHFNTIVPLNGVYTVGTILNVVDASSTTENTLKANLVDVNTLGNYVVKYRVIDDAGNKKTIKETVMVVLGNAPVITNFGSDQTVNYKGTFTPSNAECSDVEDGTGLIVTVTNPVDTRKAESVFLVEFSCTDSSTNTTVESITVTIGKRPNGQGDDAHKTAPTSGNDWNTNLPLVKHGISVDGHSSSLTDNWWTPYSQIQIETGSTHTFTAKTFAQNGGLMVQEFAFGIPSVGAYSDAETMIEVHYNYDKSIRDIVVVQDTEVIQVSSVIANTNQVFCDDSGNSMCYLTSVTMNFNEPLKDAVYAIKAFDMQRRSMMPHYFNDGIAVVGENFNPLATAQIVGTEKYEGLITVTQTEKYSDLWIAQDGRIFELVGNDYRLINAEIKGEMNDRVSDELKSWTQDNAMSVFDSSNIQGSDKGFKSIEYPEKSKRTQTLQSLDWY